MNWTLKFMQDGKIYHQYTLGVGCPIPRVGEEIRIPFDTASFVRVPVKNVQYDLTNNEVLVYLSEDL
jgi:hypothetical protein